MKIFYPPLPLLLDPPVTYKERKSIPIDPVSSTDSCSLHSYEPFELVSHLVTDRVCDFHPKDILIPCEGWKDGKEIVYLVLCFLKRFFLSFFFKD